jgi:hypothetical protein
MNRIEDAGCREQGFVPRFELVIRGVCRDATQNHYYSYFIMLWLGLRLPDTFV